MRHPQLRVWPDLLRGLAIDRPNHASWAGITYVPMRRGFLDLVAVMDWFRRRVLAWCLSNTMEADFCIEAPEAAIARFGAPMISAPCNRHCRDNTDQGSQFTSPRFTEVLTEARVRISMDARGRWLDSPPPAAPIIERLGAR